MTISSYASSAGASAAGSATSVAAAAFFERRVRVAFLATFSLAIHRLYLQPGATTGVDRTSDEASF